MPSLVERPRRLEVSLGGQTLWLDASGALYWPEGDMLAVSDLHLEKGSAFARTGSLLPALDSRDTLRRLLQKIDEYQVSNLILLGDSFHDAESYSRFGNDEALLLDKIRCRVRCFWIAGNHDAAFFSAGLESGLTHLSLEHLTFTHQPDGDLPFPQIVGHYHPKASVSVRGMFARGRCFVHTERLMIMPAFGSYTGGLDITHPAIAGLFEGGAPAVHMIYRENIFQL